MEFVGHECGSLGSILLIKGFRADENTLYPFLFCKNPLGFGSNIVNVFYERIRCGRWICEINAEKDFGLTYTVVIGNPFYPHGVLYLRTIAAPELLITIIHEKRRCGILESFVVIMVYAFFHEMLAIHRFASAIPVPENNGETAGE